MPQALAMVKREFGPDAVIVRTRSYKKGGVLGIGARNIIEITARAHQPGDLKPKTARPAHTNRLAQTYGIAHPKKTPAPRANLNNSRSDTITLLDELAGHGRLPRQREINLPRFEIQKEKIDSAQSEMFKNEMQSLRSLVESLVKEQRQLHEPQMPEQLFEMYLDLIQREVSEEIAREMLHEIQNGLTGQQARSVDIVRQRVIDAMAQMIDTAGPICPNVDGKTRVVALIGPTGVGKTTTIAKLAADLKLRQNKKVALITIDTYRIGAVDQLRMYAQIIGVPIHVVLTPADLKRTVDSLQDMDVVLIDTAGRSQKDHAKINELRAFLDAVGPHELHLVLSTNCHHSHMLSAAEEFKKLGVDRIILTKLDEAISFGVVLSVFKKIDASLSYITTGQDVPDDIEVGNPRRLAQLLLGMEQSQNHGNLENATAG